MSWNDLIDQVGFDVNLANRRSLLRPLWTIQYEDPEEFIKWWRAGKTLLEPGQTEQLRRALLYRDFYAGVQSLVMGRTQSGGEFFESLLADASSVFVNHLYEIVEQLVSRHTRYSPAVYIAPANPSETNDRFASRMAKHVWEYLAYINDMDQITESVARSTYVGGEHFTFIKFNKEIGPLHPDAEAAEQKNFRVPLLGPDGQPVMGVSGDPLFIQRAHKIGDVEFRLRDRWWVWMEPAVSWDKVNWIIDSELVDTDELIAQYPDLESDLSAPANVESKKDGSGLDFVSRTMVYTLYHRSHTQLSGGLEVKFTDNTVLEMGPLTSSHGELPVCRMTNIDVPGELRGRSLFDNILPLQVMINNLYSIAYRNIALGAHIYWMVPASAKIARDKIRNSATVLQYQGSAAPRIETFKVVTPDIMNMIQALESKVEVLSSVHPISRGDVPARLESGIALSKLEEMEDQRFNSQMRKQNAYIKKSVRFALSEAGDGYDPTDGRTIKILGKNNLYAQQALEVAKLAGPFDIRVQKSTALSESRAGRINDLYLIEQMRPNLFSNEQLLDLLELGSTEKANTILTASLQAAEFENELMADGVAVPDPLQTEEMLVHYEVHRKFCQTASFMFDGNPAVKQLFDRHILITEGRIYDRARGSLNLCTKLSQMDYFPMILKPLIPIPQMLMMLQQGQPVPSIDEQMGVGMAAAGAPPAPQNVPGEAPEPMEQPDALLAEGPPDPALQQDQPVEKDPTLGME